MLDYLFYQANKELVDNTTKILVEKLEEKSKELQYLRDSMDENSFIWEIEQNVTFNITKKLSDIEVWIGLLKHHPLKVLEMDRENLYDLAKINLDHLFEEKR